MYGAIIGFFRLLFLSFSGLYSLHQFKIFYRYTAATLRSFANRSSRRLLNSKFTGNYYFPYRCVESLLTAFFRPWEGVG